MMLNSREEHLQLAQVIKQVHSNLRNEIKKHNGDNVEDVWKSHCRDNKKLERYASAMHRLATVHWETNNSFTRIDWCYKIIDEYFFANGLLSLLDKERTQFLLYGKNSCHHHDEMRMEQIKLREKVTLLDVGSCYHPFKNYEKLQAIAIDLHPANQEVYRCDFLDVAVLPTNSESWDPGPTSKKLISLPRNHFDVVVFSLLLEYLPTPGHRWQCCLKASDLLRTDGLLLIVTPDSKHQNRNASMIKSWRVALEHIGFSRTNYTKLAHLHCLVFRKVDERCRAEANDRTCCSSSFCKNASLLKHANLIGKVPRSNYADAILANRTVSRCLFDADNLGPLLYIPQDYNRSQSENRTDDNRAGPRNASEDDLVKVQFDELPLRLSRHVTSRDT